MEPIEYNAWSDDPTDWAEGMAVTGLSHETLILIFEALNYTPQYNGVEPDDIDCQGVHSSASDFCQAFLRYSRDCFGADYEDALKQNGISNSLDLGNAVFALAEIGWLETQADDSLADFAGLFDLT